MKTTRLLKSTAAVIALALLASCGGGDDTNADKNKKNEGSAFPASLISDKPIEGAVGVVAAAPPIADDAEPYKT